MNNLSGVPMGIGASVARHDFKQELCVAGVRSLYIHRKQCDF